MDNYKKRISTLKIIILLMFIITVFVTLQFDYGMMELVINTVFLGAMALMTRYALQNGLDHMNAYIKDMETMIKELEESRDDCRRRQRKTGSQDSWYRCIYRRSGYGRNNMKLTVKRTAGKARQNAVLQTF